MRKGESYQQWRNRVETETSEQLAILAYTAYMHYTGGKTYDGRAMPAWENLGSNIQNAWRAASMAVYDQTCEDLY
jgi:hypothetical protein